MTKKHQKKNVPIPPHSKPPVEKALAGARAANWLARYPSSHAWAVIYCPHSHSQCMTSVSSTPRVPEYEGRRIAKLVAECPGPDDQS